MANPELDHLLDIPLRIEATVPGPLLRVSDLLALSVGGLVATPRTAGETVDVFAAGAFLGAGELAGTKDRRSIRMVSFTSEA